MKATLKDEADHATHVEAWLLRAAKAPSPAQLASLFEQALGALLRRAHVTLGEVTLTAIVDRVLYTASEKYPFLSTLKVEADGISFDAFRRQPATRRARLVPEVVCFVLVELLSVLGNLTNEILTPALHTELSKVGRDGSRRAAGDERAEGTD